MHPPHHAMHRARLGRRHAKAGQDLGNGPAELVLEFGGKGTGPGLLDDPRRIAVDGSGHLWVADYGDGRLQEFDPPGSSCG